MSSKRAMKQAQKLAFQKHKSNTKLNKFNYKKKTFTIKKNNLKNVKEI